MKKEQYVKLYAQSELDKAKLERQISFLLSELVSLSEGTGVRPSWYTEQHDWKHAMMHKAGLAIQKLHEMRK